MVSGRLVGRERQVGGRCCVLRGASRRAKARRDRDEIDRRRGLLEDRNGVAPRRRRHPPATSRRRPGPRAVARPPTGRHGRGTRCRIGCGGLGGERGVEGDSRVGLSGLEHLERLVRGRQRIVESELRRVRRLDGGGACGFSLGDLRLGSRERGGGGVLVRLSPRQGGGCRVERGGRGDQRFGRGILLACGEFGRGAGGDSVARRGIGVVLGRLRLRRGFLDGGTGRVDLRRQCVARGGALGDDRGGRLGGSRGVAGGGRRGGPLHLDRPQRLRHLVGGSAGSRGRGGRVGERGPRIGDGGLGFGRARRPFAGTRPPPDRVLAATARRCRPWPRRRSRPRRQPPRARWRRGRPERA